MSGAELTTVWKHLEEAKIENTRKVAATDWRPRRGWKSPEKRAEQILQLEEQGAGLGPQGSNEVLRRSVSPPRRLGGNHTERTTTLDPLGKPEDGLRRWRAVVKDKEFDQLLQKKNGKGSSDGITAEVSEALPDDLQDAGQIAVGAVLEVPGGVDAADDASDSEADRSNEPGEILAFRWPVCGAKGVGILEAGHSATDEVRYQSDSVCAKDTRRCWTVPGGESSGVDEEMGAVHGGGALGREESARPRRPQCRLQSEPVFPWR